MKSEHFISQYCHIKNGTVRVNGTLRFSKEEIILSAFLKECYRELGVNYPRFFKMDLLSKLAFLGAETLLDEASEASGENDIALLFSNSASSLDTDRTFHDSIANEGSQYPSPSVFVYTLPNIGMGEISIRHKLFSENSFFIFDRFQAVRLWENATFCLTEGKAEKALCGWVNVDGDDYEAFMYLVADAGTIPHTENEIERLFTMYD